MSAPGGRSQDVRYIPLIQGTIMPPAVVVLGAITSLDFLPGAGVEVGVKGIGAGYLQHRILVGMEGRMIKMPLGTQVGGEVIATERVTKQVVADEAYAGISRFFGSALINFNLQSQRREALQYVETEMMRYMAYRLISSAFGVRSCDSHLAKLGIEDPKGS
jgi:hypothetical protein